MYPEAFMILPMDIWKLPKNKENTLSELLLENGYFGQVKKDGFWYQFERTDNHCYLFSSNISKVTGHLSEKIDRVPHIEDALDCLPANTIVIGEIYYPGMTSKDVTTIMGCLPEKAIERQQERGYIHYYIHDIIMYRGKDLQGIGALERYKILEEVFRDYQLWKYGFLELAETRTEDLNNFIAETLADGEEGVVLKKNDAIYAAGLRPAWQTIKIKKVDTLDAVCIGFCEPTKLYSGSDKFSWEFWEDEVPVTKAYFNGWKAAFEIGAYDEDGQMVKIGTIAAGLTDELRAGFSANPELYLNKTVELQCMEKDPVEQTLRHGILMRFRDDKAPEKCLLKEIFNV